MGWLKNIEYERDEMKDLFCSVDDGDIITQGEIQYIFRNADRVSLTAVNQAALEFGLRFEQCDEICYRVKDLSRREAQHGTQKRSNSQTRA